MAFDDEVDDRVASVDVMVGFGLVVTLVLVAQPATSMHVIATIMISKVIRYFFMFTTSSERPY